VTTLRTAAGFCPILDWMPNLKVKSLNAAVDQEAVRQYTGNPALGELQILRQIRRRAGALGSAALPVGIGDDCALIRPRVGEDLAITTDLSVAGRHFRLESHPADAVGHRALARGLSDLAAMGARPVAAFLSLGLPRVLTRAATGRSAAERHGAGLRSWLDGFLDGFLRLAREHKTPLAGGDLAESPVAVADIVLIGAVPRGQALLRSGARPGDAIYVTGALGGAAAGLVRLAESRGANGRATRIAARLSAEMASHLYPQPRLAQGRWLVRRRLATAAIDISDGLSTDLMHICEESGVAAEIDELALPIRPGASLDQALHGGEDYELLFTARASARLPRVIAGIPITRVGRILAVRKGLARMTLLTTRGPQPLQARGWRHFA
jgi:thiamine-monophosphate kinase